MTVALKTKVRPHVRSGQQRKRAPRASPKPPGGYETKKAAAAARSRQLSQAGRDIGALPRVRSYRRKARCRDDLAAFLDTYFPETFDISWSDDHRKVIAREQQVILDGGQFALAMPRGSGKTAIIARAALWALLYGYRSFVAIIGSSEGHATKMLTSIKRELEGNPLLLADFPEVCCPIRALDGIANRCSGQTQNGKRTHISWTTTEIVLPTVDGSQASGSVVMVAGLTGSVRGMQVTRPDGKTVRPDLVLVDDPQTRESARSISQCVYREEILEGDVLGLAGPRRKIAVFMLCTVIAAGDLADSMLDPEKHPDWNGERTQMVYSLPTNTQLWEEYAELRVESLRRHKDIRDATAFYRINREAMDEGARVAWPERFNSDELSGIQHAMNLKLKNESSYQAEYQNTPIDKRATLSEGPLTADEIARKLNGFDRGIVPLAAEYIAAFIDVQQELLYWMVVAWAPNFTGWVLDYGTYPDQGRVYFTLRDAQRTLAAALKDAGKEASLEGSIRAGLEALEVHLLDREWKRQDNSPAWVTRCLIDANWAPSTQVVYSFCRTSQHASKLYPSRGKYCGARSVPMNELRKQRGDKVGDGWRIPSTKGKNMPRQVTIDTNAWKSFIHTRLAVAIDERGSLTLFGTDPRQHRLLADHLTSEFKTRTSGRGRELDEWDLRPERFDNHWFDGLVGCAVGASIEGAALQEATSTSTRNAARPVISMAQLQKERRANGVRSR